MRKKNAAYDTQLQDGPSVSTVRLRHGTSGNPSAQASRAELEQEQDPERAEAARAAENNDDTVDRRTSVRSILTLPAYSQSARENERILGREGERDGMDLVVDAPETEQEEEDRREEEMQSLYQIRERRRQEISEAEERRRGRAEASRAGDHREASRIAQESSRSVQQRETTGSTAMIADHRSRSRIRRVSSVSYADLGVATHDGTRIRANSSESDRPLLDSADSMYGGTSLRATSSHDSRSLRMNHPNESTAMISESDWDGSDMREMPPFGRAGTDFEAVTLHSRIPSGSTTSSSARSRASTNTGLPLRLTLNTNMSGDLGDGLIPLVEPPSYDSETFEQAPPYESPVQERAPEPSSAATIRARTTPEDTTPLASDLGGIPSIQIAAPTPREPSRPFEFPEAVR